jgi:hypothetical protein
MIVAIILVAYPGTVNYGIFQKANTQKEALDDDKGHPANSCLLEDITLPPQRFHH